MDGWEKAGAEGHKGSVTVSLHAQVRPCWPTHTPDDVRRPPCDLVPLIMLKSRHGGDATGTLNLGSQELGHT